MVLLPHSAFIGLEGFYIIQSAEILHDYHNVSLKNSSSMMTATRNYIHCLSTSYVIRKHVTFSEHAVSDICRLQTADSRLQTADCRLQTADCRLQTADCRLQTADCRLQTADCRLQNADYRLQTTECRLQITADLRP